MNLGARALLLAALALALLGGAISVLTGAWRHGALGLVIGSAVLLVGLSRLLRRGDRALGWAIVFVGAATVAGHVARILLTRD